MPTEWGEEPADAYIGHGVTPEIGFRSNKFYVWLQYTGLKDKHGKEIYEGDILQLPSRYYGDTYYEKSIGVIEWDYDSWYVKNQGDAQYSDMEIIGNIYENPELLQTKTLE